jgi:hypothetical protein
MLDHLIDFEPEVVAHSGKPTPLEKEHPADRIDAQVKTTDWLKSLGAADTATVVSQAEVKAREAKRGLWQDSKAIEPSAFRHK